MGPRGDSHLLSSPAVSARWNFLSARQLEFLRRRSGGVPRELTQACCSSLSCLHFKGFSLSSRVRASYRQSPSEAFRDGLVRGTRNSIFSSKSRKENLLGSQLRGVAP